MFTRAMTFILASVFTCGILATSAHSAVVTYTLSVNENNGSGINNTPGTWTLYADVSQGDNAGLVVYGVALSNTLTILNDGPKTLLSDSNGVNSELEKGFNILRSANNASPINAAQDVVTAGAAFLVIGFGQTGGNLQTPLPPGYDSTSSNTQTTYAAHLKIAHGTYNTATFPTGPTFDLSQAGVVATKASVFQSGQLPGVVPGNTFAATIIRVVIPEPTSLTLLTLASLPLLTRRRKI